MPGGSEIVIHYPQPYVVANEFENSRIFSGGPARCGVIDCGGAGLRVLIVVGAPVTPRRRPVPSGGGVAHPPIGPASRSAHDGVTFR